MDAQIQKAIDFLLAEWKDDDFDSEYITIDEEEKTIDVQFPRGEETYSFTWDEFVAAINAAKSMEIDLDKGTIRASSISYQLVHPANDDAELFDIHAGQISIIKDEHLTVSYFRSPFLITFAAVKHRAFHEFWPPENYRAVELKYESDQPFAQDIESQVIDTFLFELAATRNLLFVREPFEMFFDPIYDSEEYDLSKDAAPKLRPLERFNHGMRLYLAALQAKDPELRFLSLYKVLEYFAPVVLTLEENDAIRKKLDSPSVFTPDGSYIRSIADLASRAGALSIAASVAWCWVARRRPSSASRAMLVSLM